MSKVIHFAFLLTALVAAGLGALLWTRWGAAVWLADLSAYCG